MKTNRAFLLSILYSVYTVSGSFACQIPFPIPDVTGLTLKEAEKLYGKDSHFIFCRFTFIVRSRSGNQNCGPTLPDCTRRCPKEKIVKQKPLPSPNIEQQLAIEVDIEYNDVEIETSPFCNMDISGCSNLPREREGERCLCSTMPHGKGWIVCRSYGCFCRPDIE